MIFILFSELKHKINQNKELQKMYNFFTHDFFCLLLRIPNLSQGFSRNIGMIKRPKNFFLHN